MSRILSSLVALVFLVVQPTISAAANTTITINGVSAGTILGWEGGDPRATVVSGTATSDGSVPKQLGNVTYAPLVLQFPFPPSGLILKSIGELCSNEFTRKKIVLTDYDAMGRAIGATEFDEALISEVQFPALDATSGAAGSVTLVFDVEQSRKITPAATAAMAAARATATNFRLAVAGLDGTGVTRIEAITIRLRKSSTGEVGATRDYTATPAQLELPNLAVTLVQAKASTWRTWFTDFVINGNSSGSNERSGSIELLDSTMKSVLTLSFQRMGIVRLSRTADAASGIAAEQAELYFEKLSIGAPASGSGGSESPTQEQAATGESATDGETPTESGSASTTETQPLEWTPAQAGYTEMATGMLSDGTATTDAITPMDKSIAGVTTSPTTAGTVMGTTSIATTTTTNPNDQGSRDPAGFPRVEGLTRISYSGSFQSTYTQEQAVYTAPEGIYVMVARVEAAAAGAAWTLTALSESESSNGKSVSQHWTKAGGQTDLSYLQPAGGATKITVNVHMLKPTTN